MATGDRAEGSPRRVPGGPAGWRHGAEILATVAGHSSFLFYRYRLQPRRGFQYVSANAAALIGYTPEEHYADPDLWLKLVEPTDRPVLASLLERARGAAHCLSLHWRRRDGHALTTRQWGFPVFDGGALVAIEGVAQEVTGWEAAAEPALHGDLLNAMQDAVLVADVDGRVVFCNGAALEMYGWEPEEPLGAEVVELTLAEEERAHGEAIRSALRAGTPYWTGDLRRRRKDGAALVTATRVCPIHDAAGRLAGFVGVSRDVTARRDEEEVLGPFFSLSLDLLCIAGFDGFFKRLNPAWEAVLGFSQGELLEQPFLDFVHPDDRLRTAAETERLARGGEVLSFENRYRCRDGTYRWILWKAASEPARRLIYAAGRDITKRKEAERTLHRAREAAEEMVQRRTAELARANRTLQNELELREMAEQSVRLSEQRYRDVFDHAPVGICQTDEAGAFLSANATLARMLGYGSPAELVGRNIAEEVYLERTDRARLLAVLEREGRAADVELRWRRRDGAQIWVQVDATRVADDGGRTRYYEAFVRDIDQRKVLESRLAHAQRMEAVGQLAGGVAHDFNNLLTAMLGYADLLLADVPEADLRRPPLEEIRMAALRAAGLTRQLLAFSRRQVLQPAVLDLNEVLFSLDKMLRRLIPENIELASSARPDLWRIKADRGQLEQVIVNLVVNARDAMPDGGRISISTANLELLEPLLGEPDLRPGSYVVVTVADTGCGMDPETRKRIFEPFFTTKEQGKGTGLGLSTVYGILKQSGGHVSVYSELGKGSVFRLYLPATDDEPSVEASRLAAPRRASGGGETILVVEDESLVRDLVARVLAANGYRALVVSRAEEALEIGRRHPGPIHLLLSDVVMPDMDGAQLSTRLTALRPEARVLYMSGYTGDAILRHGVLEPGVSFLEKPFTAERLAKKLREVLDAPAVSGGQDTKM